jgi:hypothetical protein
MDSVRIWLETTVTSSDYPDFDADTRVLDEPFRGVRPASNYLSLQMIDFNSMRSSTGDPGWFHDKPSATVDSVIRVQCFGEEAWEWLNQALSLIFHSDVLVALAAVPEERAYQLEPTVSAGISDLSALLDQDYEIRGFVDVTVSCRRVIDRVTSEVVSVLVEDYDALVTGESSLEDQIIVSLE